MAYIQILNNKKQGIRMNNQSDFGFDLIVNDVERNRILSELEEFSNEDIHLVWELKKGQGYKLYYKIHLNEIKDNIDPWSHSVSGKVLAFSCSNTDYYTKSKLFINNGVYHSKKKWKDAVLLERAIKLSNLSRV